MSTRYTGLRADPMRAHADCVLILVYAKPPRSGRAKTRLAQEMGTRGASELAAAFLADTLERVRAWGRAPVSLVGDAPHAESFADFLHLADEYWAQGDGDLGARLARGFRRSAETGYAGGIAIGSDTPHLPIESLDRALAATQAGDIVLGPAADGGYYLLGVPSRHAATTALFHGHPWGEGQVLASTRSALALAGLAWKELPEFWDIDHPGDLVQLQAWCEDRTRPTAPPRRTRRLVGRS